MRAWSCGGVVIAASTSASVDDAFDGPRSGEAGRESGAEFAPLQVGSTQAIVVPLGQLTALRRHRRSRSVPACVPAVATSPPIRHLAPPRRYLAPTCRSTRSHRSMTRASSSLAHVITRDRHKRALDLKCGRRSRRTQAGAGGAASGRETPQRPRRRGPPEPAGPGVRPPPPLPTAPVRSLPP